VSAEHCQHIMTANHHKPAIWIFCHCCASLQMRPQKSNPAFFPFLV